MKRDFSEANKENLLGIVKSVENEKLCDLTDWIGDRWFDFEEFTGALDIKHYVNNVNEYHRKVIDKNNTSADKINEIFSQVHDVDNSYGPIIESYNVLNNSISSYIQQMADLISPGNGSFASDKIANTLKEKLEANSASEEFDETIANIAEESGLTVEEVMAYVLYGKKPISDTKKAQKILETAIKYQKGKTFLKGKEITVKKVYVGTSRESTRVYWNGKPLYDQETDQLFKSGKDLKEASEIDISKARYAWTAEGKVSFSEMGKAGWSSFKSAINPLSDFKGWKGASNLTKAGKALGIVGTTMTVINNVNADFINADGGINSAQNWRNFAVDTGVDLASGAGATAIGAAAGSLVAPPLGTVVGAGFGMFVSWGMNQDWFGGKSVTTWAKDSLKGLFN